ncbi:hypothetical protein M440DRAFT_1401242 [Trichoderma longibrachiatum ATCC 18648]|uniref:Uncharacterized protein n=1 Tax=Trichoderma longibrachiatum ATCC 18648 TaxID=983965 RepID=A0A2T4C5Q3_TRILO|nr:hypothetical protein M440DRAFT_1401242 [Trichoderma longibrachiatum ATCC 18648]
MLSRISIPADMSPASSWDMKLWNKLAVADDKYRGDRPSKPFQMHSTGRTTWRAPPSGEPR